MRRFVFLIGTCAAAVVCIAAARQAPRTSAPAFALRASARQAPRTSAPLAPVRYSTFFTTETMRVDYLHTGGPGGEVLALDRVVADGAWPGSRTHLLDEANLGEYLFEVADLQSGQVVYSRGFGSIYGEWQTTPEIRETTRTFQESVRFPWPKAPVRVTLKRRDAQNAFQAFWWTDVDPQRRTPADPTPAGRVWTVSGSGPSSARVDVLLISDGYTAAELPNFHADAKRLVDTLFAYEPFKSRKADFVVRALDLPAERSAIHAEYNIFGIERYILTYNNRALRNAAALAPYDVVELLVNNEQFGGGGIFNLQGTVAVGNERAGYVFVHEFAHNFAGLADEYVGNVTYETGGAQRPEPWEPNLTLLRDPPRLKWRDLVAPDTPLPTPSTYAGRVGAFEGGGYVAHGLYRPEAECLMGSTRDGATFCRVCQRAITRVIDQAVR